MAYKHIVFDIDGTMIDSEYSIIKSLERMLSEVPHSVTEDTASGAAHNSCPSGGEHFQQTGMDLRFVLGIPGPDSLDRLGISDQNRQLAMDLWVKYLNELSHTVTVFPGIRELLTWLKEQSYHLGIISSQYRDEFEVGFAEMGLADLFDVIILGDDTTEHKPNAEPMECYLKKSGALQEEVLYIGDSIYDMKCAGSAGVNGGLAVWGCHSKEHIQADHYFRNPEEVRQMLIRERIKEETPWLSWATELQFIAQAGLTYSRDPFDLERFTRIREISAEIMEYKTGLSMDHIKDVFCNETGFQTPKLDTRAAVFQEGKILLVKEQDGLWSLPGGWVDVNQSIRTNTVKEVKEETGLDVVAQRVIAIQDRNLHNRPIYAYGICKVFIQCKSLGGEFRPNMETLECGYFSRDSLPLLSEDKCTKEQIMTCFQAYESREWDTVFD